MNGSGGPTPTSALDGAGGHALDDLPVEEDEHDQRWDGDQQDGGEQQVVLGGELALEVEQGELNGGVLGSRQEVQRVLEVVVDDHRLEDDHRHDDRAQYGEDDPEEDLYGPGPVDDCGFIKFPRDCRDEGAEEKDAEWQPEGDLHEDQSGHGFEQADGLQHPDGRHNRRWHDQTGQDEDVDHAAGGAGPALPDVGDHGAEDDQGGDAGHSEDHAVDKGDDHQIVASRQSLCQVVEQLEVLRPGELQRVRSGDVLGRNHEDEEERHHEEEPCKEDGRYADDHTTGVLHL